MYLNQKLLNIISIIYSYYRFGKKVHIFGNFKIINYSNVKFGKNCVINHGVFIIGRNGVHIGDNVILSVRCMLIDAGFEVKNYLNYEIPIYNYTNSKIVISDNVWIGAGAIILPGVTIGRNSVIAAGAVVSKNVRPYCVVAGNPAVVVRDLNNLN